MLLAILFSIKFIPQDESSGNWNVASSWGRFLLRFDSGWYLKISQDGYTYVGNDLIQSPVAFFPLYPLTSRFIATLLGLDHYVGLLIVSNGAILIAMPLAFKLIKDEYGDHIAFWSLTLLSFFPTALFFSTGYTESLTLLFIIVFFLLLKKEQFILAALCAGFAAATRPAGIVLLLPLLWAIWERFSKERKRLALYAAICLPLATSGLWLYMTYLRIAFNSPFAFITAQRAWISTSKAGDYSYPIQLLLPFRFLGSILRAGPNPISLDPWFFFLFLSIIILFRKKLPKSYTLFALGILLLPYFTFGGVMRMRSFTRYAMLAFPVFIIMADLFKGKLRFLLGITALFAIILFVYTARFAQWYWAG